MAIWRILTLIKETFESQRNYIMIENYAGGNLKYNLGHNSPLGGLGALWKFRK